MVDDKIKLKGSLSSVDNMRSTGGMPMKYRETSSGIYKYYGIAVGGTLTSEAGWRIWREDTTNGNMDLSSNYLAFGDIWDNVLTTVTFS